MIYSGEVVEAININCEITGDETLDVKIEDKEVIYENDYRPLEHKPDIEGAELKEGMALEDIGIRFLSNEELEELLK